jgi:predicted AAA+ superfamily ATPase
VKLFTVISSILGNNLYICHLKQENMRKDVIKSLIALRQNDIPFEVIERDVELPINRKKIITVPGVRRCGKSTMMEIAINNLVKEGVPKRNILWIGFDDERLFNMSSDELDDVIVSYMEMFPDVPIKDTYMFFDEIQLIKGWEYFVLRVYKSYCKNIYVCGSNAAMLSSELGSALRGYPLEYEAYPLSFNEFCRFKGIATDIYLEQDKARLKNAFDEYNRASAFPEIVLTPSRSEQLKLLHGYFDTMILRDLAEHYNITNTGVVRYFVKRIMANLTKPTSINAIYNDIKSQGLKVSKDDLYLWADYACNVFMFVRTPRYNRSIMKEHRSLDKFYCIDNGLRSAVLMPQSNDNGKNLENTVFMELYRRRMPSDKISYYQEKTECDFVIQREDRVMQLIQVTWSMADDETRKREIKGLLEASSVTGCDNLLIITDDEEKSIEVDGKKVNVVPAWKWLLNKGSI